MKQSFGRTLVAVAFGAASIGLFASAASAAPEQAFAGNDTVTGVMIGTQSAFVVDHDDIIMTIAAGFGTNNPHCTVLTQPTHGTLSLQPDPDGCDFFYDAASTFPGSDMFTYSVTFGTSTAATATVTLTGTPAVTTTTTAAPTTTTAAPATTTTTLAPTTTVAPTSAAVAAVTTTTAKTTAAAAVVTTTTAAKTVVLASTALPSTGTNAALVMILAALLLFAGCGFLWMDGRRKVALHRRWMKR